MEVFGLWSPTWESPSHVEIPPLPGIPLLPQGSPTPWEHLPKVWIHNEVDDWIHCTGCLSKHCWECCQHEWNGVWGTPSPTLQGSLSTQGVPVNTPSQRHLPEVRIHNKVDDWIHCTGGLSEHCRECCQHEWNRVRGYNNPDGYPGIRGPDHREGYNHSH